MVATAVFGTIGNDGAETPSNPVTLCSSHPLSCRLFDDGSSALGFPLTKRSSCVWGFVRVFHRNVNVAVSVFFLFRLGAAAAYVAGSVVSGCDGGLLSFFFYVCVCVDSSVPLLFRVSNLDVSFKL